MNNKLKFIHLTILLIVATIVMTLLSTVTANASITKVGNGDDGSDLEGAKKVTSGILVATRTKAIERIKRLDPASIDHLGSLLPELERSEMYLVSRDIKPKLDEDRGLESDPTGDAVFARTFAEPHAATRFFPAALTLDEEQLIALHVHEALHRALPPSVRENEKIVTKITLALVSPDSTIDRVRRIVRNEIPSSDIAAYSQPTVDSSVSAKSNVVSSAPIEQPSTLSYSYRVFFNPDEGTSKHPIKSLHSFQSFFYPFGEGPRAFGLGIEGSYVRASDHAFMGPLNVSARMKLASVRGYDVSGFIIHSMQSTSNDEFKNSPLGRDLTTIGLIARRETSRHYIENALSLTGEGDSTHTIDNVRYVHTYGALTAASVKGGFKYEKFEFGGFGEILLADGRSVSNGTTKTESGRYRIISAGPELAYVRNALKVGVNARWILNSTSGATLDDLGDIMGHGLGQGSVSSFVSWKF